MNNKTREAARVLCASAESNGFLTTLSIFGKNLNVNVPVPEELAKLSLDGLNLSVRSYNCLRRAGLNTAGELVAYINEERPLAGIRNLGKKSQAEIKTRLLREAYERLNAAGKLSFWEYVAENNMIAQ